MQATETERIRRAWQAISRLASHPSIEQRLGHANGLTITRPARLALAQLNDGGPLLVSELAARCTVDVSTMSRTLQKLCEAELVQREACPDQRAVLLSITEDGRRAAERINGVADDLIGEALEHWTVADVRWFDAQMTRFAADLATLLNEGHGRLPGKEALD